MLDNSVTILRTYETTALAPGAGPEKTLHVEYKVKNHGPFTASFGAAEQVPDKIHERLNAKARLLREIGAIEAPKE